MLVVESSNDGGIRPAVARLIDRKAWHDWWQQPSLRRELVVTLTLFGLHFHFLGVFFDFAEARAGGTITDPVLAALPARQLDWCIFSVIYLAAVITIWHVLHDPHKLLIGLQAYLLLTLARVLAIYVTQLDPPLDLIPLRDPFADMLGHVRHRTKDLFFSGHTSAMFLFGLLAANRRLRVLFFAGTAMVGLGVLIQHVHYTVDVVAAPFFTYTCYQLVVFRHAHLRVSHRRLSGVVFFTGEPPLR